MEIIKQKQSLSAFNEVQKLVSKYKEIRIKTFESYERKTEKIVILTWLFVCTFLFFVQQVLFSSIVFTLLFIFCFYPRVTESKKFKALFFPLWRDNFKKRVYFQREEIALKLLFLSNSVKKMMYDEKWVSIASEAKKIMGV